MCLGSTRVYGETIEKGESVGEGRKYSEYGAHGENIMKVSSNIVGVVEHNV